MLPWRIIQAVSKLVGRSLSPACVCAQSGCAHLLTVAGSINMDAYQDNILASLQLAPVVHSLAAVL